MDSGEVYDPLHYNYLFPSSWFLKSFHVRHSSFRDFGTSRDYFPLFRYPRKLSYYIARLPIPAFGSLSNGSYFSTYVGEESHPPSVLVGLSYKSDGFTRRNFERNL